MRKDRPAPVLTITAPHLRPRRGLAADLDPRLAEAAGVTTSAPVPAPEPPPPRIEPLEPTLAEMAGNFTVAVSGWIAAGAPVVSEAVYQARSAACGACELWDPDARFGLGKCKAPGCGCTKLKRWLATARCTHPDGSRWPA